MAPKLSTAKHEILRRLISSGVLEDEEIAGVIPFTTRSVRNARDNYYHYGTTTAPPRPGGRPRVLTRPLINALLHRLKKEDDLTLDELVSFLWESYRVYHERTALLIRVEQDMREWIEITVQRTI
jgi:transposase